VLPALHLGVDREDPGVLEVDELKAAPGFVGPIRLAPVSARWQVGRRRSCIHGTQQSLEEATQSSASTEDGYAVRASPLRLELISTDRQPERSRRAS
jgi:hypothetical protein